MMLSSAHARSEGKLDYIQKTAPERVLPSAGHIERVLYDNAAHEQEYLKDSSLFTRVHRAISEIARGMHVRFPAFLCRCRRLWAWVIEVIERQPCMSYP